MGNKILVVEDEKDLMNVLSKRLSCAGYEVFKAITGEEAIRKAEEANPDLILLDVMLPGISGFEVKERLNNNTSTKGIPTIFLTAASDVTDKVKGFNLGVDDYVTKPFESEELLARIVTAINRKKYYEEISMTDGLTGLYNIHYFKKELKAFFSRTKRYKLVFSLAVVDLDDLKTINDTYGHILGDAVLRKLAEVTKKTLRETDIITRYGGDEFAIIMPEVGKGQGQIAIDRLKNALKSEGFVLDGAGKKVPFSVSAGIEEYRDDFKTEGEFFRAVDAKMYEDKSGR